MKPRAPVGQRSSTLVFLSSIVILLFVMFLLTREQQITTKITEWNTDRNIWYSNLGTRSKSPINFHLEPDSFISSFASCIYNAQCHIYFWHVQKTGGTTIENTFFRMFPPKLSIISDSCCHQELLDRIQSHRMQYCKSRFVSLQLTGAKFENFIHACRDILPAHHEIRVLISFREPSHLTLSAIHQHCNKNLDLRTPIAQTACRNCDYYQDPEFWISFVQGINSVYGNISHCVNHIPKSRRRSDNNDHADTVLLTLETPDINLFLMRLKTKILNDNKHFRLTPHKKKANPENASFCNFGMTSPMLKELETSRRIYRDLLVLSRRYSIAAPGITGS